VTCKVLIILTQRKASIRIEKKDISVSRINIRTPNTTKNTSERDQNKERIYLASWQENLKQKLRLLSMKNWLQRQFKEFDNLKLEEELRLKQLKVPSSVRK
jgi:hypothetical protein